jgi:hypothetical protein
MLHIEWICPARLPDELVVAFGGKLGRLSHYPPPNDRLSRRRDRVCILCPGADFPLQPTPRHELFMLPRWCPGSFLTPRQNWWSGGCRSLGEIATAPHPTYPWGADCGGNQGSNLRAARETIKPDGTRPGEADSVNDTGQNIICCTPPYLARVARTFQTDPTLGENVRARVALQLAGPRSH